MEEKEVHIQIKFSTIVRYVTVVALTGVLFVVMQYVHATTPNPGHSWTDVGNGTWQVANTQTSARTFTFPDADATVFTSANASTTMFSLLDTLYVGRTSTTTITGSAVNLPSGGNYQINGTSVLNSSTLGSGVTASSLTSLGTLTSLSVGGLASFANASSSIFSSLGPSYFGATATSSFDRAGVLTLVTPLAMTSGGTGASLSVSNGGVVWTDSNSMEVLAGTATAGQILRSGASAAPSWSTATYPATAGTSGNVLQSDGTNFVSSSWPTVTTWVGRSASGLETGAMTASSIASLTTRNAGLVEVPFRVVVNQVSFNVGTVTTAGTIKICVYSADGNTKYIDVTSGTVAAGNNNVSVSAVTLMPGNYYVVVGCATTCSDTVNSFTTTANTSVTSGTPASKTVYQGTVTHTSGTCNSTLGTVTVTNNTTPIIRFDN